MSIKNLDELKAQINIVNVIKNYVPLKKIHGSWKGLCPFHAEKTPSFSVSEQKGLFHCFGCKEGGDAFAFVQKFKHYDFNEAVREIADIYNFELEFDGEKSTPKKDYFEFYARLNAFFKENLLKNDKVLAYLAKRGLSKEDLHTYDIGLVPDNYKLIEFIGKDLELALATGLLIKGQNGTYSQFARRLSFAFRNPIFKIVGFSCRIHPYENFSNSAKYINSRESFLFHKSHFLYNLNYAKNAYFKKQNTDNGIQTTENRERNTDNGTRNTDYGIQNTDDGLRGFATPLNAVVRSPSSVISTSQRLVIVEGFFDAIALSKLGHKANVASCGTAFNQIHLATLLKNGIENYALCFDKDKAGLKATLKTCELLFKHGFFESEVWQIAGDFKDIGEVLEARQAVQNTEHGQRIADSGEFIEKINAFEFYVRAKLAQCQSSRDKDKFLKALLKSISAQNNYFLKDFCFEIVERVTGFEFKHTHRVSLKKVEFNAEKALFKTILCDESALFIARELLNSAFFDEYESSFKLFIETGELDEKAKELKIDESVSVLSALDFDSAARSFKKAFLARELEKAKVARNFTLICDLQAQLKAVDEIAEVF